MAYRRHSRRRRRFGSFRRIVRYGRRRMHRRRRPRLVRIGYRM